MLTASILVPCPQWAGEGHFLNCAPSGLQHAIWCPWKAWGTVQCGR